MEVFAVDADNDVALAQSGLVGGFALVGLADDAAAFGLIELYDGSHAGIFASDGGTEVFGFLGVEILGIRVEVGQHGSYGSAYALLGIECVDVVHVEQFVDLTEHLELGRCV